MAIGGGAKSVRKAKRFLLIGLSVSLVMGAIFLIYSAVVTFSNWPWTRSQIVVGDEAFNFAVGASKRDVLLHAIKLQHAGSIRAVIPLDVAPVPYDQQFHGTVLTVEDLQYLNPADRWHIGISGKNAWFVLEFRADKLNRVERKEYFGPTE